MLFILQLSLPLSRGSWRINNNNKLANSVNIGAREMDLLVVGRKMNTMMQILLRYLTYFLCWAISLELPFDILCLSSFGGSLTANISGEKKIESLPRWRVMGMVQ